MWPCDAATSLSTDSIVSKAKNTWLINDIDHLLFHPGME